MDRFVIAERLRRIARLLDRAAKGTGERFKGQAYRKGAQAIESAQAFESLVAQRRLTELPGIGKGLAAVIAELATTGRSALEAELVATLGSAGDVGGEGEAKPKGFLRPEAFAVLEPLVSGLEALPGVEAVEVAGALRRGEPLVEALEVMVVGAPRWPELAEMLRALPEVVAVEAPVVTLAPDVEVRLHCVAVGDGWAELEAVGPASHVEALRARGVSVNAGAGAVSVEALYEAAGLWVAPPELRDLPLEALRKVGEAPYRLLEAHDVLGLVHCHSLHSDGRSSVMELAKHAAALGYRYLTLTDHSPTASYARGVTLDRIERQWEEIEAAREATGVDILRGTESDILADGALDYPDWLLEKLDVVIVSIHNRYKQDAAAMTRRLVRALRHPVRKIWGHPLGRLLRERPPVECQMEAVLEALVGSNTIVELNGDPKRMDLPPEWARRAASLGVDFVVSADAHAAVEMRYVANAVSLARKAGLGPERVINTRSAEAFRARVKPGDLAPGAC